MPGDPDAAERMKLLNKAWEVLSDPRKRQEHDRKRPAAKIGKIVAQARQARPNAERRHGQGSPEAMTAFSTGADDAESSKKLCWFCMTRKPDGRPLLVRLHAYRWFPFTYQKAAVDIPRCYRCERAKSLKGWIGSLGCLLMLLGIAHLAVSRPWGGIIWNPEESATLYHASLRFFYVGSVFLLGFLGHRLQKDRAKEFPKVRHLLNRGWRIRSLVFPWQLPDRLRSDTRDSVLYHFNSFHKNV
jgi:hypothetical protein